MTNLPISTFTGSIQDQPIQLVNARDLHEGLQISTRFTDWIQRRISDFNFIENLDFTVVHKKMITEAGFFGTRETEVKDYHLTLDMAKELCMLERSAIGRKIRRHFINMEAKALRDIPALEAENAALKARLAQIPAFVRDPDLHLRLLERAQQALFTAQPECREIVRYREMGLTNAEIGKLLELSRSAVEKRLAKLFELGLCVRKTASETQLALTLA